MSDSRRAQRRVIVPLTLAAAALLLSIPAQRQLAAIQPPPSLDDPLFISSPQVLKRLSLGYSGLLADVYWTRAVQYFGGKHHVHAPSYDLLAPLLDITTTLDPKLIPAYEFGSTFLAQNPPEGSGQPALAAKLVQKGIRENPKNWHLYYTLGFVYYDYLRDYPAAAKAFRDGSKVPGALPWMRVMAAKTSTQAGDFETSRYLWSNIYSSTEDPSVKDNALRHLIALKVDQDVTQLQQVVSQYEDRFGIKPASFRQLVAAGLLPGEPLDPLKHPYTLQDGLVVVSEPDALPFISKGLPLGARPQSTVKSKPPSGVNPDELFQSGTSK